MTEQLGATNERRESQRYKLSVPLTAIVERRQVSGYTRDMSNRGVYFYLERIDGTLLDPEFEFVAELPPEITLSTPCHIRCRGRAVRTDQLSMELMGVAAEIMDYSIFRNSAPVR